MLFHANRQLNIFVIEFVITVAADLRTLTCILSAPVAFEATNSPERAGVEDKRFLALS